MIKLSNEDLEQKMRYWLNAALDLAERLRKSNEEKLDLEYRVEGLEDLRDVYKHESEFLVAVIEELEKTVEAYKEALDIKVKEKDRAEKANDKNVVDRNHWRLKYVEHSDLSNELQEQFDEERELHGDTLNDYDDLLEKFEGLKESKDYWKEAYEEQGSTADHYRNLYYDLLCSHSSVLQQLDVGEGEYQELFAKYDELHGEYQAAVSDLIALEEGYDHVSEVGAGYQDQLVATKEQLAACEEALTNSMNTTEFVVDTSLEAIEQLEEELYRARSVIQQYEKEMNELNSLRDRDKDDLYDLSKRLTEQEHLNASLRDELEGTVCSSDFTNVVNENKASQRDAIFWRQAYDKQWSDAKRFRCKFEGYQKAYEALETELDSLIDDSNWSDRAIDEHRKLRERYKNSIKGREQ